MAVNFDNFGFFDYVEGELDDRYEYNSDEYSEIMDSILGTGIIQGKGDNLACESGAGAVIVNTGVVVVDGRTGILHESKSVLIDSVESGYSRIDRIVARKDLANRIVCLDAIKGTPTTGTPTAPELTRDTSIYEVSLCRVLVTGNGIIVTDERGDATLCGYIPQYNNLMGKSMYDTNNDGVVDAADDAEKLGGHPASYFVPATKPAMISFSGSGITWEANWAWFDGRQVHINFSGRTTAGTDAISGVFAQLPASIPRPSGDFFIPAFFRKATNDTVHFGRIVVSASGQISTSADSGGGWMAIMAVGCYPAG
ncbi:hypothetical protein [Christensenella tenuis]|uniref:Uncharacterized protein n=1 Tax=Christensenella tenuis TaxID=2763033 RepID=A0ABR7ECQ8_9FIRM|nr:hypothetical protein [Christensenella tenuis]MBC5647564.1 hypothetical protein [Christensenella tenuis]